MELLALIGFAALLTAMAFRRRPVLPVRRPRGITLAQLAGISRVAVVALALAGCSPAYVTTAIAASTLTASIGAFHLWSHAHRVSLVAGCADATCRAEKLAPYEAELVPVSQCIAVAAPLVAGAQAALDAKDAKAAMAVAPQLAAAAIQCAAAIAKVEGK